MVNIKYKKRLLIQLNAALKATEEDLIVEALKKIWGAKETAEWILGIENHEEQEEK